jgi:hypothetical protein
VCTNVNTAATAAAVTMPISLLLLLKTLLISSGTSSSSSSAVRVAEQLVVSSCLCQYSPEASEALVLHTSSSADSLHCRCYPPQVLVIYARKQVVLNLKVEAIAQQCPEHTVIAEVVASAHLLGCPGAC